MSRLDIDLRRALRIGIRAELLLGLAQSRRGAAGVAHLDANDLDTVRELVGLDAAALGASLTALRTLPEIVDAAAGEGGGVAIHFLGAAVRHLSDLPAETLQSLRQHGIDSAAAGQLLDAYQELEVDYSEAAFLQFALRELTPRRNRRLPEHWMPGPFCRAGLDKRGAGAAFIDELVPEFILRFNENPKPVASLDLEFFRFAALRWQQYVNAFDESTDIRALPEGWRPSRQVLDALAQRGMSLAGAERLLPHFRLRNSEQGEVSRNWGLEFIKFCAANPQGL